MITVNTNPPGFEELIEGFDEVSLPRQFFVFVPDTHRIVINLDFTGNEADITNIPIIRDAIAEYLRSDTFTAFIESDYLRNDRGVNMEIGDLWPDIWFRFPNEEDEGRESVNFISGCSHNFDKWRLWRQPSGDVSDGLTRFFGRYGHRFLDRQWQVHYVTDGVEISIQPHVRQSILRTDYYDYEAEFTDEVLALFDRIKPDLPGLLNGQFNTFLESIEWLDINDGFTITVHFNLFNSPPGHPWGLPASTFTTVETLIFTRTDEGEWIKYEN